MNTRIFTRLLQKAGIEVIEAFRNYMKSSKALNPIEPTLSKKEFGKFLNRTIKPLVKDKDTTIITGRSKSNPEGKETNLIKFLENSLSKTDTFTLKIKSGPDKGKAIKDLSGKVKQIKKKKENRWETEEEDLQNFLTTGINDLLPGSVMRRANIGRLGRGEREFIYEGYRDPTIRKLETPIKEEINSDKVIRLLFNKLKGKKVTGVTSRDILKYLKEETLGIPAKEARRAIADPDPQILLPLAVKPKTKFGVRGFKGETDPSLDPRVKEILDEPIEDVGSTIYPAGKRFKVTDEGKITTTKPDPDFIPPRQEVGETQTPTLTDLMRDRYGAMAEFEPAPGDVRAYRADLRSIYDKYRTQLQSSFGPDAYGMNIQQRTLDDILKLTPEEKALLPREEQLVIRRTKQIYQQTYDRARKQGASPTEADAIAREEALTVIASKSIDEDFSFISPEKVFLRREEIRQIKDPKVRAKEELEELGSRIVEPVDVRPSRQYSLNDLIPDPNVRQAIRKQFKPEELEIAIREFLNPANAPISEFYRTQGGLKRYISDIPPERSTGVAPINLRALTRYTKDPEIYKRELALGRLDEILDPEGLQKDFINFLLGERRYAKGGKVKAKKKKKIFIPKILQKRNIRGKRTAQRPLGIGASLKGWGAVRRVS